MSNDVKISFNRIIEEILKWNDEWKKWAGDYPEVVYNTLDRIKKLVNELMLRTMELEASSECWEEEKDKLFCNCKSSSESLNRELKQIIQRVDDGIKELSILVKENTLKEKADDPLTPEEVCVYSIISENGWLDAEEIAVKAFVGINYMEKCLNEMCDRHIIRKVLIKGITYYGMIE